MNEYSKDCILEQKKRDLDLIRAKNTKIECKNMKSPSQKLGTARATSHMAVPPAHIPFCCFLLPGQAAY